MGFLCLGIFCVMAVSAFAWPSVVVKRGVTVVGVRSIVKAGWEENFGQLLCRYDEALEAESVEKVEISTSEAFIGTHMFLWMPLLFSLTSISACMFAFP